MNKIGFLILFFLFTNCCLGQRILINENGSISISHLIIDTIVNTNFEIQNKVWFEKIDTNQNPSVIKPLLRNNFDYLLKDTVEYYSIANLTKNTLYIDRYNNDLVGQDYGKFNDLGYKPISLFLYPGCSTGYVLTPLQLNPRQLLIIKSITLKRNTNQIINANCFIKLKTKTKQLNSKPFKRNFSQNDFYFNTKDAEYLKYILSRRAFPD